MEDKERIMIPKARKHLKQQETSVCRNEKHHQKYV